MKKQFFLKVVGGIFCRVSILLAGTFFAASAFATGTAPTIGSITTNVQTSVSDLAKIIQDISTVAGVGFIFSAFFKFHQHKMQPTQVPLSQGVTMLLVGAGLTVFPHLLSTVAQGVFGTSVAKISGSAISNAVGGAGT